MMETSKQPANVEMSVVMPCLNEEATIGTCIQKAQRTLKNLCIQGEVVVADNGSTDASVAIAQSLGARVVHQPIRGYGAAYLAGLAAARGKSIVISSFPRSAWECGGRRSASEIGMTLQFIPVGIGRFLIRNFPPLQTVHATFTAYGFHHHHEYRNFRFYCGRW